LKQQQNRDILALPIGSAWLAQSRIRTAAVPERPHLDLDNYLPYLLNRVGFALVESFTTEALKENELSIDMWRVLAALSNNGGQRQVDLSGMTSIDVSTMSRLVSRLVRMGLVTRSRSEKSNREVVVALAPKGRSLVRRLIPIANRLEQVASADVPAKDMAVVKRTLRRFYANLANGRARS
jgi:DNA-binding MarR family transcriptional regulator